MNAKQNVRRLDSIDRLADGRGIRAHVIPVDHLTAATAAQPAEET